MIWSPRNRPLFQAIVLAMAPEAPDPKSLKTWHDAFQYPIPTVRRVEQELRRDIASNKEKLRALVGYAYFDRLRGNDTDVDANGLERGTESWSERQKLSCP